MKGCENDYQESSDDKRIFKTYFKNTLQTIAQRAAAKVVVEYENLPAIITIDDAIKNNSFYSLGTDDNITKGDPEKVLSVSPSVDHVAEGEVRIGGQEHFYLETNAALVKQITLNFYLTHPMRSCVALVSTMGRYISYLDYLV